MMTEEIGDTPSFRSLIGLELTIARLVGDMRVFGFGAVRAAPRGGTIGAFALHLQCAWRITGASGRILTGNADLWDYVGPGDEPDNWEPAHGQSRQTRQLDALLGLRLGEPRSFSYASGISVIETSFDATTGDVSIQLSAGHCLSVFPDSSRGEQWRLFSPGRDAPHLVFELPD